MFKVLFLFFLSGLFFRRLFKGSLFLLLPVLFVGLFIVSSLSLC